MGLALAENSYIYICKNPDCNMGFTVNEEEEYPEDYKADGCENCGSKEGLREYFATDSR